MMKPEIVRINIMNTEIIRIIRAALDGDKKTVIDFALLLAKNAKGVNDSLSNRIIRELSGTPTEDTLEEFE